MDRSRLDPGPFRIDRPISAERSKAPDFAGVFRADSALHRVLHRKTRVLHRLLHRTICISEQLSAKRQTGAVSWPGSRREGQLQIQPVTSTDLQPSSGLRRAAASERQRIDRFQARLEAREQRLQEQLKALRAEMSALDERRRLLDQLAAPASDAAATPGSTGRSGSVLRGRQLRERAAQILFARYGADYDVHYRRWLDDVLSAGYEVVAKDPPAAFLTTASRSPLVIRGTEPGTYRIDLTRAESLRRELSEAEAELADLASAIASDTNPSVDLREHRTRLTATTRRLERDVAEVDRVLNSAHVAETDDEIRVYRAA